MSDQEDCKRICGEAGKRGVHSIAPVMCPFAEQEWKRPTRTTEYGTGLGKPAKKEDESKS